MSVSPNRDRLLKVLRLLGSSHDGERAAAALKAQALAEKLGGWDKVLELTVVAPDPNLVKWAEYGFACWKREQEAAQSLQAKLNAAQSQQQQQADVFRTLFGSGII